MVISQRKISFLSCILGFGWRNNSPMNGKMSSFSKRVTDQFAITTMASHFSLLEYCWIVIVLLPRKLPKTQYGIRSDKSTIDMVFIIRQLEEKAHEQSQPLNVVVFNLTKAFDSVNQILSGRYCLISDPLKKLTSSGCSKMFLDKSVSPCSLS